MTAGKVGAVIVAAGRGTRMGGVDKCALPLCGEPVLLHSVRAFAGIVDRLVVVVAPDQLTMWESRITSASWPPIDALVAGGETRGDSVRAGVAAVAHDAACATVLIHDGARPLVSGATIRACIAATREHAAAITATPVTDTIKRVQEGVVVETPDRAALWAAQTPQGFDLALLRAAFAWMDEAGSGPFTDEAAMVEASGQRVHVVRGETANIKVTSRVDLLVAAALLRARGSADG